MKCQKILIACDKCKQKMNRKDFQDCDQHACYDKVREEVSAYNIPEPVNEEDIKKKGIKTIF